MDKLDDIRFLSNFFKQYTNESIWHLLNIEVFKNTLLDWVIAMVVFSVIAAVLFALKKLVVKRFVAASEEKEGMAETMMTWLSETFKRTRGIVIFLFALYAAAILINLPKRIFLGIQAVAFIAVAFQVGIWGNFFIYKGVKHYVNQKVQDPEANSGLILMNLITRGVLWALVFLIVLQNLGVNVSTLVASLGIGGIAIGLATQNIIGDLFASLSILLDRPFEVGHFIVVDNYLGTVEKIGIKTTRLRSLSGELLVFGNNDLLKSRIQNFKHFWERRVVFSFGVVYSTPADKLEKIGPMVKQIIEGIDNTRFDRGHLKGFGASSMDYEIVYYVLSPDFNVYMDIQQKINLGIIRAFEKESIEFAFPTRTLYVAPGTA